MQYLSIIILLEGSNDVSLYLDGNQYSEIRLEIDIGIIGNADIISNYVL